MAFSKLFNIVRAKIKPTIRPLTTKLSKAAGLAGSTVLVVSLLLVSCAKSPQSVTTPAVYNVTAYSLPGETTAAAFNPGAITVTLPYGTNLTNLVATFTTTANVTSVKVGNISQISGTTPNNFSNPITYVLNGTTQWIVTVYIAPAATGADMTAFSLPRETEQSSINSAAGTVNLTVASGTDVTAMVATFKTSDLVSSVKVGNVSQTSGITPNNFTKPVTYTVTAQDGKTKKNWVVTVTVIAESNDATLSSLTISAGSLTPAFASGTAGYADYVDSTVSSVTVTPTTNSNSATVSVDDVSVTSGSASPSETLVIGANEIIVTVTAENSATKTYAIAVTRGQILTINISGSNVAGPGGSVAASPSQNAYAAGTAVTLTETPTNGWTFKGWSSSIPADLTSTTSNPDTITMNSNETVTATFVQNVYTLTINVNGDGSVAQSILPGSGSSPSSSAYTSWSEVQLTAIPAAGWSFTGWAGSLEGSSNPDSLILGDNVTVTATFQIVPSVTTGSSSVGPNSVTLNGNLTNLGGSPAINSAQVAFEWGLGTDYGSITVPQLQSSTGNFKASITGIAAGTTYHYRAMATGNGTGYGADQTFTTPAASANANGWWNSSWTYRAEVDISGTGTALTDYQISLSVPFNSNMETNFGDVRFVSADNTTVLDYWMNDEVVSSSATFWVKVPTIAASGTTKIYMYYGNTAAATTSNIHTTFIYGDDFNDPTYTQAHITPVNSGAAQQGIISANGVTEYEMSGDNTNTNPGDRSEPLAEISNNGSLTQFPSDYIAEEDVETFIQNGNVFFCGRLLNVNWKYEQLIDFQHNQVVENKVVNGVWTTLNITPLGSPALINDWYQLKAVVLGDGGVNTLQTYVNGIQYGPNVSDSDLSYPSYNGLAFLTFSINGPFNAGFQDVRVRQYAAVEPTVSLGASTHASVNSSPTIATFSPINGAIALLPILHNSHFIPTAIATVSWTKLDEIFLPLNDTGEKFLQKTCK
jgi:hypothetical protein